MENKKILVIGAEGMLGQTVFKYLKTTYPNTLGTSRKKSEKLFYLSSSTLQRDFKKIIKETKELDFAINCIGILPTEINIKNMSSVNSLFPKNLSYLSQKYGIKIIHISTDAVFSSNSGIVYENTRPDPDTTYGKSKLKGEVNSPNFINIRTSIIGLDLINHKGLLEWAKSAKKINGYSNHTWTGCTTLQFAKVCEYLIKNDNFNKVRSKSSIIHYSPLGPISKYDLIYLFLKQAKITKEVIRAKSQATIDRQLKSIYNILPGEKDINIALSELINFFRE